MAAIDIAGVSKTFGSHSPSTICRSASTKASIYGFIGPNGSGKTTTLRMIMNILLPDRGDDPRARALGIERRRATTSATCRKSAGSTAR